MPQQAAALFDLPADAGRWPRGDDGWCGEPAIHNAYCEQHHRDSRAKNQRDPSPLTINRWLLQMNTRMVQGPQTA
jgi:hypothetical protein